MHQGCGGRRLAENVPHSFYFIALCSQGIFSSRLPSPSLLARNAALLVPRELTVHTLVSDAFSGHCEENSSCASRAPRGRRWARYVDKQVKEDSRPLGAFRGVRGWRGRMDRWPATSADVMGDGTGRVQRGCAKPGWPGRRAGRVQKEPGSLAQRCTLTVLGAGLTQTCLGPMTYPCVQEPCLPFTGSPCHTLKMLRCVCPLYR